MAEMKKPRVIMYDPEADILTVNTRPGARVAEDTLLDNDTVVSYSERGEVVQVQVLQASRQGLLEALLALYRARRALLQLLARETREETVEKDRETGEQA